MELSTRLGHYEILDRLGAGGMGQVYRARDTTLDRDVAIKVLPEDFASGASRLARFEREAKVRLHRHGAGGGPEPRRRKHFELRHS